MHEDSVMTCVVCGEDTTRVEGGEPVCMNCHLIEVIDKEGD